MATHVADLDALATDFFREFARTEYCLKIVGLTKRPPKNKTVTDAKADWIAYARTVEVAQLLSSPSELQLTKAIAYYTATPPRKQIVKDGNLAWDDTPPGHKTPSELLLQLVCRTRNNLFHGGKFNGKWFEPQRSAELLIYGLQIMRACIQIHPKLLEAYSNQSS